MGPDRITVTVASGLTLNVDFTRMVQQLAVNSQGVRAMFRSEHQRPAAVWMWMDADGLKAYDLGTSSSIESGFQIWIASGSPSDAARRRLMINIAGASICIDFQLNLQWEIQGAAQVK